MAEGKILELKRWEKCRYLPDGPDGAAVTIELRRLKRHEAKALRKVVIATFGEIERGRDDSLSSVQKATIMAEVFNVVPEEELRRLFTESVGTVEGLSIDGEPINTGPKLLDEADDGTLFFVLMNLHRLATLSSAETFRSASPSTSSAEAVPSLGSSSADVPAIESEASIPPSTAPEIQLSPELCSVVEP